MSPLFVSRGQWPFLYLRMSGVGSYWVREGVIKSALDSCFEKYNIIFGNKEAGADTLLKGYSNFFPV